MNPVKLNELQIDEIRKLAGVITISQNLARILVDQKMKRATL